MNTFNPQIVWDDEITAKTEAIKASRVALRIAKNEAAKRRENLKLSDAPDLIGAFNQVFTVQELLIKAGYKQRGNTFVPK